MTIREHTVDRQVRSHTCTITVSRSNTLALKIGTHLAVQEKSANAGQHAIGTSSVATSSLLRPLTIGRFGIPDNTLGSMSFSVCSASSNRSQIVLTGLACGGFKKRGSRSIACSTSAAGIIPFCTTLCVFERPTKSQDEFKSCLFYCLF